MNSSTISPQIGQRWLYDLRGVYCYIVEIITDANYWGYKVRVVQNINAKDIPENYEFRCHLLGKNWHYLVGQDKP
jgi:hypothetical protein